MTQFEGQGASGAMQECNLINSKSFLKKKFKQNLNEFKN